MSLGTDQKLDKRAIPIKSDRRFRSHLQAPLPVLQQGFAGPHPLRINEFMPACLKPSPAQIETQRQPKPAEPRVCKNKPCQSRLLYHHSFFSRFHRSPPFSCLEICYARIRWQGSCHQKNRIVSSWFVLERKTNSQLWDLPGEVFLILQQNGVSATQALRLQQKLLSQISTSVRCVR